MRVSIPITNAWELLALPLQLLHQSIQGLRTQGNNGWVQKYLESAGPSCYLCRLQTCFLSSLCVTGKWNKGLPVDLVCLRHKEGLVSSSWQFWCGGRTSRLPLWWRPTSIAKHSVSLCIEGLNDSLQSLFEGQESHFGGPHPDHLITSQESHHSTCLPQNWIYRQASLYHGNT